MQVHLYKYTNFSRLFLLILLATQSKFTMEPRQQNKSASRQPQDNSSRSLRNHHRVSFFPVAPYVIYPSTNAKRWTNNVACCVVGPFQRSKHSQTICSELIRALSEDPRFTIRATMHNAPFTIDWHVPGYWILSSMRDSWVKLFEFGCFVLEIAVPRGELNVL